MPRPETPDEHASAHEGDKAAKEADPHGVGVGDGADQGAKPAAVPNADRHETERAGDNS